MRRTVIFLILVFVLGCSPHVRNSDSHGSAIICFGDSITYGTGAAEGEDYPTCLSKLLKRNVINAGVAGDKTSDALLRVERDVLEKDPYIVIVELGGNDFLEKIPIEGTLKNLEEIISKIQDKGAMVVLCDVSCGIIMWDYRNTYKKLAKKTNAIFIPGLLSGILTDPSLKFDQIHPNSKGYEIIAKRICNVIRNYTKTD